MPVLQARDLPRGPSADGWSLSRTQTHTISPASVLAKRSGCSSRVVHSSSVTRGGRPEPAGLPWPRSGPWRRTAPTPRPRPRRGPRRCRLRGPRARRTRSSRRAGGGGAREPLPRPRPARPPERRRGQARCGRTNSRMSDAKPIAWPLWSGPVGQPSALEARAGGEGPIDRGVPALQGIRAVEVARGADAVPTPLGHPRELQEHREPLFGRAGAAKRRPIGVRGHGQLALVERGVAGSSATIRPGDAVSS